MLISGVISPKTLISGLTADSEINPIKILILFLSLSLMSVLLDSAGFFRLLASKTLGMAKHSQWSLFISLYLTVSVLTVFTSNDIIVLTFTPFICYFAHSVKINPLPYLIGEFVAANTWSMALIIGNPTNIYLSASAGIDFWEYISVMLLPTLLAGSVSLSVLCLIFRKSLSVPMSSAESEKPKYDKVLTAIGLLSLAACIILMATSSLHKISMWKISLFCFLGQYLISFIYCLFTKRLMYMWESFKRTPIETVPFVLSMFTLVLGLTSGGRVANISEFLLSDNSIIKCGIASFLSSNLINNIPMSVLFSSLVGNNISGVFAAVIGSNLGAFLTPVGALAGIMWTGMLKNHGVKLSFLKFSAYGTAVALPTLAAAIFGLYIAL